MEKEDLILELYKNIWSAARHKERLNVQYLGIIVSAVGLVALSLYRCPNYLYLAVFVAQVFLIWGMVLAIEAGYEYRRYHSLSARIEKKFEEELTEGNVKIYDENGTGIIPPSYHKILKKCNFTLPDIYKIHIRTFAIIFGFIMFIYLKEENFSLEEFLKFFPLIGIIGLAIPYCHFCKRKDRHKRNIEEWKF